MKALLPNSISSILGQLQKEREEKLKRIRNSVDPRFSFGWDVGFAPIHLGSNFAVIRSWQVEELKQQIYYQSHRKLIKIDPGVSFGWANATTEMVVELLEKYWQCGTLLDVGTGTGILSIAAALWASGEFSIDAFDISESIVKEAKRNLQLNGLEDKVNLKVAEIDDYPSKYYDVVLANLLPDVHQKLYKKLFDKIKKGGLLIISGFPTKFKGEGGAYFDWLPTVSKGQDRKQIEKLFKSTGLLLKEHCERRDYSALVFQK